MTSSQFQKSTKKNIKAKNQFEIESSNFELGEIYHNILKWKKN